MHGNPEAHRLKVEAIARQVRERIGKNEPVHISKGGVRHVVPLPGDLRYRSQSIDISSLDQILEIDPERRLCTAEPGVPFSRLVPATLAHGLLPTVVPELEGITVGGAIAGGSVESMSFRYGGLHDSCVEYEIIGGSGEIVTCSPTQEPLLFSGTVAENIGYGREGATREEIEWAAGVADADGFIRALPEGYQTRIGERGTRLSGGQKQRVALARALLAKAPVLLLDEATSNLDAESEREVTRALGSALRERTALVIAHRFSTIRNAHRIAVIKGGKVFEQGTHDALLAADGEYARLYRRQAAEG